MAQVLEKIFNRKDQQAESDDYSPYALEPDFTTEDAREVRTMEDYYIRLGHMTEADRMRIPPEIEFPEKRQEQAGS